jgi:3'(2'), 5'-bisphosphate nucleotidase
MYNIAIGAALLAGKRIMEVYDTEDFGVTEKADHSPLTLADRAAHEIIALKLQETGLPLLSEEGRNIPYSERVDWNRFWLVDPLDGTKEFIKRNGEFTVNIALIEKQNPVFGVVYAPVLGELYVGLPGQGSWQLMNPPEEAGLEGIMAYGQKLPERAKISAGSTLRVVASRSHLNDETREFLENLEAKHGEIEIVSKGSSLKLCMVASGEADTYPRLGPTMEWDVAAAHAVVNGAGKHVRILGTEQELRYNKEELLNPWFLVR